MGLRLDCDRTNGNLRQVYQSVLDRDGEKGTLTGPTGNHYGVRLALEKVNCICDGTCNNGDPNKSPKLEKSTYQSSSRSVSQMNEIESESEVASISSVAGWNNQRSETEVSKERISIQLEYFGIISLASITLVLATYIIWRRSGRKKYYTRLNHRYTE